jgi:ADP-ribose pyrophosphatase YjhB (NUDIX family)
MPIKTDQGDIKPIIYLGAIGAKGLLIVKYKVPPNPLSPGWWLPAPEINYGEDPSEGAAKVAKEMGLDVRRQQLIGIDSFVNNNAWHFMCKYRMDVAGEVSHENIEDYRWVTVDSLPPASEFAHGNWEVELCRFFLGAEPALATR